jgi:hypothetical protein
VNRQCPRCRGINTPKCPECELRSEINTVICEIEDRDLGPIQSVGLLIEMRDRLCGPV